MGCNSGANAGTLASTFQVGVNTIHDTSGEIYIPLGTNTTGNIAVGDTFLAFMDLTQNQNTGALLGTGTTNPQLTGVFAVVVTGVSPTSNVSNGNFTVNGVNVTLGAPGSEPGAPATLAAAIIAAGLTPSANVLAALSAHSDANTFGLVFSDPGDHSPLEWRM